MERRGIEPGILPAFRFLVALRMGLIVLGLLLRQAPLPPEVLGILDEYELPGRWSLAPYDLAASAILTAYLAWGGLERRLGRGYLLLALAFATIALILVSAAAVATEVDQDSNPVAAVRRTGRLVFQLTVPLILCTWQYRFGGALAFSALTTVLEMAVLGAAIRLEGRTGLIVAGIVVGQFLLFCLIAYLADRLAEAQRVQRRALTSANRELGRYAATLEELAVSRERNRLARELHDTLAHSLSALAVQLEGLRAVWDSSPSEARAMLDRSLEMTRLGLVESRRAIRELRASPLEGLGLALALRQLAESTAERARLELDLALEERLDLEPAVEQGLYRIADEALANVARHAGARRVSVRLERRGQSVRLSISDDGSGFDLQSVETGDRFGLQGMDERARLIGGILRVDSRSEGGTAVRVTVGEWQ